MATINPILTGVPVEQLKVGDWAMVVNDDLYTIAKNGAIGRIVERINESNIVIEFEPDTCVIPAGLRWPVVRSNMTFTIGLQDVVGIEPPTERIAEREEYERCQRHEALRTRARAALHQAVFTDNRRDTHRRRNAGRGAAMAEAIREALDNSDFDPLLDCLNDAPTLSNSVRYSIIERAGGEHELSICAHCDAVVYSDTMNDVIRHSSVEMWCEHCAEDEARWSECMGTHIDSDCAIPYFDSVSAYHRDSPIDWCTDQFGSRHFNTYEGVFVDLDTYDNLTYSEDEDDEAEDGLSGYHDSYRVWKVVNSTPEIPAIGMELELYAYNEDRAGAVREFRSHFSDWYLERDGSLDDVYGFEVITQPYGPNEWKDVARKISLVADSTDSRGYAHYDDCMYGIHLNVDRRKLSPLQELRMLMFMQWDGNREFLVAIAQRDKLYSSGYGFGRMDVLSTSALGGLYTVKIMPSGRARRKPLSLGKYSALYLHDGNNIAEFRLFQSTTRYEAIMKNLEFVWALIAWTSTAAATGLSYNHRDFVKWLGATHKESTYPHLFAYLRQPVYKGKHFSEPVINTWATLLPATTTKSLDVVVADLDSKLEA